MSRLLSSVRRFFRSISAIGATRDDLAASAPPSTARRSFLKMLGIGATQTVVPAPLQPAAAKPPPPPVSVMEGEQVRGAHFRLTGEELAALKPRSRIRFRREPTNAYDSKAVAIDLVQEGGDRCIGYLPREKNKFVSDLMDAGHEIAGELTEPERFTIHHRLRSGEALDPQYRLIEEIKRYPDGNRIVQVEVNRPLFRAWLSTGHADNVRLPAPDEVAGKPGWKRLGKRWRPAAAELHNQSALAIGQELSLHKKPGPFSRVEITGPDGAVAGSLDGSDEPEIAKAIDEGKRVVAVLLKWRHRNTGEVLSSATAPEAVPIFELRVERTPGSGNETGSAVRVTHERIAEKPA
jgi:HIRAN domain